MDAILGMKWSASWTTKRRKIKMTTLFKGIAGAVATACLLSSSAWAQDYTLRIGSVQAEGDPVIEGFHRFAELVSEGTGGAVEVQVFANGALGNTQDMMDQAQAGANVAAFTDAARLAAFTPEMGIIGAPYVFSNYEEADRFTSSDTFAGWADQLQEDSGFVTLAFNWYQGPRYLLTNKPITSRADMEGVRIRTPGAPAWVAAGNALGGTVTPLAWAEIYSSLQTGAIDAAEAHPAGIVGMKFYEVVENLTKTAHIQLITGIVVGETWWNDLPAEHQAVVRSASVEAGRYMSGLIIESNDAHLATIAENGVTVSEIDTSEFQAAAAEEMEGLGLTEAYAAVKAVLNN
jgi:tripartite ATP-independent transporter DctP family solute receptor